MIGSIVRLLVAVALGAALGPICFDILQWAARVVRWPLPDTVSTIAGSVLGVAFACWRRPSWFAHTWVHEHAHVVVYVALHLRWPSGLYVSDGKGGEVEHFETDAVRSVLVRIAPYTLPLLLTPVLLVRHFAVTEPGPWRHVFSGLAAFLIIHHVQALYHNVRINISGDQSDLVKVGRPLSFVLIALAMLLLAAWTIRALWSGLPSGM